MERVPGLDFLRAIAILSVMWFHALNLGTGAPFGDVAVYGWMGVDIFFALSGYLIGWQLFKPLAAGRTIRLADFYWRRAFRILPAYFVVLLLYFAFPVLREAPGIQPLWQFISFSEGLLIDYSNNQAFSHVWSLCVEEHFYLVLPGMCLLLSPWLTLRRTILLCLAVLMLGVGIRAYLWLHDLAALHAQEPIPRDFYTHYIELIYYPSYTRLDGLLGGVMVALLRAFRPELWQALARHSGKLLLAGLASFALSVYLFSDRFGLLPAVVGFPLLSFSFAALVAAAALPGSALGRLKVPGAAGIASIAFSLYLSHKIAFHVVASTLPADSVITGVWRFALCLLVAVAMGALLYFGIERPFLKLRERWLQRPHHVEMPAALTEPA